MLLNWLPVLFFLSCYSILTVLGSVFLLFHLEPFTSAIEQQAGFIAPFLSLHEKVTFLYILIGGPLCFVIGYKISFSYMKKTNTLKPQSFGLQNYSFFQTQILFYIFLVIALMSLSKINAFSQWKAWYNYEQWINTRWNLFASLSFFEFVNLYTLLPFLAVLVWISGAENKVLNLKTTFFKTIFQWLPLILTIYVDLMLYQKKPMIETIILFITTLLLQHILFNRNSRTTLYIIKWLFISFISIVSIYTFVVLLPNLASVSPKEVFDINVKRQYLAKTLNYDSKKNILKEHKKLELFAINQSANKSSSITKKNRMFNEDPTLSSNQENTFGNENLDSSGPIVTPGIAHISKINLALLNMIMRSASPSLYYTIVFPKLHPYFTIDIGQDILGFGKMPDDNHVVWQAMYPNKAGVTMAPINFVFYSQGGVLIAFMGMCVVGSIVSICWYLILYNNGEIRLRSLLGAACLLLSILLGLDSLRNIILCSYGLIWPVLFIILLSYMSIFKHQFKMFYLTHRQI